MSVLVTPYQTLIHNRDTRLKSCKKIIETYYKVLDKSFAFCEFVIRKERRKEL